MAVDPEGNPGELREDTDMVVTLGTPVGFTIPNLDARPGAYDHLRDLYRPNHADFTYDRKYGLRDWRGGGRSSGRETAARVVAGSFATQLLETKGITVCADVTAIGGCDNPEEFDRILREVRETGDSVGGIVTCRVNGVPAGLGEPVFGKLQQMLASAMLSIGGVHGFEYGNGFGLCAMRGSEAADQIQPQGFLSNHSGGILGGISNGEEIIFRVGFKPTPSISRPLRTVDSQGNPSEIVTKGRHDPCIALRGAEVVKAMASVVMLDAWLMNLYAKNF
jgi:chorismate synthase